jgi:hypothetical protein
LNNLLDTSKTFRIFFDACPAAGKERCAFWEETPDVIRVKWDSLQARINEVPIFVYLSSSSAAGLSDHGCSSTSILYSSVFRKVFFNSPFWQYAAF